MDLHQQLSITKEAREARLRHLALEAERRKRAQRKLLQQSYAAFVQWAWPLVEPGRELKWNWSVQLICELLQDFAFRHFFRFIINIPPRNMKSYLVSVFFPIWVWIQDPEALKAMGIDGHEFVGAFHQFLCLANEEGLALRDAQNMRNILESKEFIELFGDQVFIPKGQNKIQMFRNNRNGHRNSKGMSVTAKLTGRGGDTVLIDDPHDATQAMSDTMRQSVLDTYAGKVTSRLNDWATGGMGIIMQRVHGGDLVNFVIKKDGIYSAKGNPKGWVWLVLPMEWVPDSPDKLPVNPAKMLGFKDPRTSPGELLWEERFPLESVRQIESDLEKTSGVYGASCQLQQQPAPAEGGILKKKWFQVWPNDKPYPMVEHVFLSWDTAFTDEDLKKASYTARTVWGVFWHEQMQCYCLIMLHAWAAMVDYPTLRKKAQQDTRHFQPEAHLIEKKASGQSLVQDLRRTGHGRKRVRLRRYNPDRDKVARAHAASSPLSAGLIFIPNKKWAHGAVEHCSVFPNGPPPCEDVTDTVTQAILYLKNGWWIQHPDDEEDNNQVGAKPDVDEDDDALEKVEYGYYG